jgi:hypothetical protein
VTTNALAIAAHANLRIAKLLKVHSTAFRTVVDAAAYFS